MEFVSHHPSGTQNFKMVLGFFKNLCDPYLNSAEMFVSEGINNCEVVGKVKSLLV